MTEWAPGTRVRYSDEGTVRYTHDGDVYVEFDHYRRTEDGGGVGCGLYISADHSCLTPVGRDEQAVADMAARGAAAAVLWAEVERLDAAGRGGGGTVAHALAKLAQRIESDEVTP